MDPPLNLETFQLLLFIATGIYLGALAVLLLGLNRLKSANRTSHTPFVTVIVPARNEMKNLAACIESIVGQTYPPRHFEVLVVDDHSQDSSPAIAQEYTRRFEQVFFYPLGDTNGVSPKKAAIQLGVQKSRGDIILTTDADCRVSPSWIETMVQHFETDTGVVTSWVQVEENNHFLSKLETLDAFALVLIGASSFGLNKPFLASGANFAYRKEVFEGVNGFDGISQMGSGDDDLLIQKICKTPKWKCRFAADSSALVSTAPQPSLRTLMTQRFRWASKANIYPKHLLVIQVLIYLYYLLLAIGIVLFCLNPLNHFLFIVPFVVKMIGDGLFVTSGARRVNRRINTFHMILAEWLQLIYVLVVGLVAIRGTYTWKGRKYSRGRVKKNADPAKERSAHSCTQT